MMAPALAAAAAHGLLWLQSLQPPSWQPWCRLTSGSEVHGDWQSMHLGICPVSTSNVIAISGNCMICRMKALVLKEGAHKNC